MGQHEAALSDCRAYTQALWADADILLQEAYALQELERDAEAFSSLDQLLATDADYTQAAVEWLEQLSPDQLPTLIAQYASLQAPEQWVDLLADQIAEHGRSEDLKVLAEAHRRAAPSDADGLAYVRLLITSDP